MNDEQRPDSNTEDVTEHEIGEGLDADEMAADIANIKQRLDALEKAREARQ